MRRRAPAVRVSQLHEGPRAPAVGRLGGLIALGRRLQPSSAANRPRTLQAGVQARRSILGWQGLSRRRADRPGRCRPLTRAPAPSWPFASLAPHHRHTTTARTPTASTRGAGAASTAGDLAGYRDLFAERGRDRGRPPPLPGAPHARRAGPAAPRPAAPSSRRSRSSSSPSPRRAVELLEEEPREPVLLNYAGVALYELGSLDAAEALFRAAPPARRHASPHVESNLERDRAPPPRRPAPRRPARAVAPR